MSNKINLAVCLSCGDILHSTHRHDFVQCSCDNHSFVDGGNEYKRRGGQDLSLIRDCMTHAEAKRLSHQIKEKKEGLTK